MRKLERYLEFNWPKEFAEASSVDEAAIKVMRNLDQELGGKSDLISHLVEALGEAADYIRFDTETDIPDDPGTELPNAVLRKIKAALAKAGEASK